ncbi:hypothetical protein QE152_g3970 [Popillia japonica]|uniref:Uncharacterized protein n=1 Tax=Popillia japonica TaxID=7064 RepID=A0AAW1N202_POPJA
MVLRYLKGTASYNLEYVKGEGQSVVYTDAAWAGCILDRHSYTGFVIMFSGGPLGWCSRKQKTVALSATEAEYIAISEAGNDNQAAGKLTENTDYHNRTNHIEDYHNRTKHIDVKYHFIRELHEKKELIVAYCPTENMVADVLTKRLSKSKHLSCVQEMGLVC